MSKRKTLEKRRSVGSASVPGSMGAPGRDVQFMSGQQKDQQSTRKNRTYQELKREIEHKRRAKEKVRGNSDFKKNNI